jgi:hypothetical protein
MPNSDKEEMETAADVASDDEESSSSGSDMDDDGEAAALAKLETLNKDLIANPYNYTAHVDKGRHSPNYSETFLKLFLKFSKKFLSFFLMRIFPLFVL